MVLLPLFIGLYKYKILPTEYRIITWYLFLSGICSLLVRVLAIFKINNLVISHVYTVIEIVIIYNYFIITAMKERQIIYAKRALVCFLVFAIFNIAFIQNVYEYNSYPRSLEAIILILFSITSLSGFFDQPIVGLSKGKADIYITSGILVYFSSSLIIFIIFKAYTFSIPMVTLIWNTHATFLLIMYILFAIGLWKYKK